MTEHTLANTLDLIKQRLKEQGDMPIFSASVNRVQSIGADPDADAMELSLEILKDANLTAKVLKLANSPLFNRGLGRIANLSRAVVVLGFDTVKSVVLTLKLIESFQQQFPGIDMSRMLVNSFLSAAFVRGISARCGIKDIEQVYICGLLHNLGEIVTAYALPEQFVQILELQRQQKLTAIEAEKKILGATLRSIGQEVAKDWEFPNSVSASMGEYSSAKGKQIRSQTELITALTSLAGTTMGMLYDELPQGSQSLAEVTYELAKISGIKKEEVSAALEQSFKESCGLAQSYGLDKKHLVPRLRQDGDEQLEKLAMRFSFYANSEIVSATGKGSTAKKAAQDTVAQADAQAKSAPGDDTTKAASPVTENVAETGNVSTVSNVTNVTSINNSGTGNASTLLGIMFEINAMIAQKTNINVILDKVLEAMQRGIGFDRVILCLLSPDHKHYAGRMAHGIGADAIMAYFNFPVDVNRDLFSKIILTGTELLVNDIDQSGWRKQLPENFEEKTGAHSFMLATLRSTTRPLGIFYADKANSKLPISSDDTRMFTQLAAQAQLALQIR